MKRQNELNAPIIERLSEHAGESPVSFHVPGHRYGEAWKQFASQQGVGIASQQLLERFGSLLPLDVTELSTTDDLHAPEGVIAESQRLAAALYGADETMLLVGGSTSGNIAMILAVCEPGDTIIVQRNVHKSIVNGLRLAGATAVFVRPAYESEEGTATVPKLCDIAKALQLHPDARAVLISTPNYYGYAASLRPYAELAHQYGIPLLVDEAHGAHYGLHDDFPPSALSQGADAVVQSTHKTLPAMTMGAMLHIRHSERLDAERLREVLTMVQSSSPSYPIMASLDIARAMAEGGRHQMFEPGLAAAASIREHIRERAGRLVVGNASGQEWYQKDMNLTATQSFKEAEITSDPLRVIIRDRLGLVSGYELQKLLERHGCWAEMADERRVLLIIGPYTGERDIARLIEACESIEQELGREAQRERERITSGAANLYRDSEDLSAVSEPVPFSMRRIRRELIETVPVRDAAGNRCAETIIPYPPGIPLVYAGEILTAGIVSELERLSALGAKVQGPADPKLQTVRIIRT